MTEIHCKTGIIVSAYLVLGIAAAAATTAQPTFTTTYGMEFSTIGDAGNRNTTPEEGNPIFADVHDPIGAVDYEYRIARNEVTIGQYFEFVQAYAPRYAELTGNTLGHVEFTGRGIRVASGFAEIRSGFSPNRAADMSWEYAARYVNWLSNGKVNEDWAFETGAYDTSTFTQNEDGSWNHQAERSADARFWIPSQDEWTKAAYWDPEKDSGEGGYWLFPNGSDTESAPGLLPEDGGERNAGPISSNTFPLDVGSFTDVQSPWGLFDLAGGESEWSESLTPEGIDSVMYDRRFTFGTRWTNDSFGDPFFPNDIIGSGLARTVWNGTSGLRLAASVPASESFPAMVVGILCLTRRRKRCLPNKDTYHLGL